MDVLMPDQPPTRSAEEPARSIDAILAEIALAAESLRPPAPAAAPGAPTRDHLGARLSLIRDGAARHEDWRQPIADWAALKGSDDATFIEDAYRLILGRPADEPGFLDLREKLSTGAVSRARVLRGLLASAEAKDRGVSIRGLGGAINAERAERLPIVGRIFRLLHALLRLPQHLAVIERRLALGEERQIRIIRDLDGLFASVNGSVSAQKAIVAGLEEELTVAASETQRRADRMDARLDAMDSSLRAADDDLAAALRASNLRIAATEAEQEGAARLASAKLEQAKAVYRKTLLETAELGALITEARKLGPERIAAADPARLEAIDEHALDELYLAFENKFRGAPEEIAARCKRYLPLLAATPGVVAGGAVLDIGCGRGEWLTLLKEIGLECRGVDLNRAMVAAATERGHEVIAGDAIAYLRGQPADSLGAITAFHLVEHLPFAVLMNLLEEANRVLKPGGAILFETPNPECLVVGACNFYYDPTHRNPLPPGLLRFLAEERAFAVPRIIRRDEDCDLERPESGFAPAGVNDWFSIPMDYALYARRV